MLKAPGQEAKDFNPKSKIQNPKSLLLLKKLGLDETLSAAAGQSKGKRQKAKVLIGKALTIFALMGYFCRAALSLKRSTARKRSQHYIV